MRVVSNSRPLEKRPQARKILEILVVHLVQRQRWQKTLWMKGSLLLEKANMSILHNLLPLFLWFVLHLSLYFAFFIFHCC